MDRPIYECIAYDLGSEELNLKQYKKDLEKYTDFLETKRTKQLNLYIVVKWFALIMLLILVQVVFRLISDYFETIKENVLLFGGWMTCVIYYTLKKKYI